MSDDSSMRMLPGQPWLDTKGERAGARRAGQRGNQGRPGRQMMSWPLSLNVNKKTPLGTGQAPVPRQRRGVSRRVAGGGPECR
jgi:hypothetical protein